MANPYDLNFLTALMGQAETQRLEFKSSRDLLEDNPQKRNKFISEQLSSTVSAFLNTDGGQLIVGLEERDGSAYKLSDGVPRPQISWERLQSAICGLIQPAVAGYVSVFSVEVERSKEGEQLYAFIVDVKAGTTAYQAADKKYYVRRSGQSEAMEDKDVRLRMLAGDKPRLSASLHCRQEGSMNYVSGLVWDLRLENVGVKNIPRAIIYPSVEVVGLSEDGTKLVKVHTRARQTTFENFDLDINGLLPGMKFDVNAFRISSLAFNGCQDISDVSISANVIVHIDDGLPVELRNYDLMADLRSLIDDGWRRIADA